MLSIIIFTFILMLLLVSGMAVGILMGREPIKGSCGGMKALSMGTACEICGDDPVKCSNPDMAADLAEHRAAAADFYDASHKRG